ncbi:hypothetical protein PVAND_016742 [Polypedilum vanderplanki]|uniref:Major facilitator superfamily (MFS) profile domain-containing protein n=1 Tax=Polypedilum vanderplanki TaxID=319348 RepID=A0A9J6BH31_POLVA|nr:hypothetical protein PVAND_016742 [Polypedilum vanderplanki]
MDFDLILDEIGEFGKFQLLNYLLICLPVFYAAANSLSYVFTARNPNYRCFIDQCDDYQKTKYETDWVKDVVPGTISQVSGHFTPENCLKYEFSLQTNLTFPLVNGTCDAHWFSHDTVRCNQWMFEEGETTIVNEWPNELTCSENQWKLALIGSIHFAGIMIGSGIFGFLADCYGRKKIFIIAIIFMSITGVGQAVSTSYLMFAIFALLNAIGTSGVYPLAFVLGVEMVGKNKREMSGVVLNYFYSVGEALVGIIAWLDGNWRSLQYWVSVPPIAFIVYHWVIPESARWLIAKKRNRKALKIISRAAKNNGVELSQSILDSFNNDVGDDGVKTADNDEGEANTGHHVRLSDYIAVAKSKVIAVRCLILFFIWGTNAFVFYGLSLNSVNLSGNIYLNFILGCLIEIPGNSIAWIIMNKIGRRLSLTSSLLLCGVTCIAGGFVPEKIFWVQILLFLVGKMAITSSFAIVFVYSAEMIPTIVRSGGVGAFSTFSRLGALLAPFVPLLKFVFNFLPLLIFGVFAFLSGLLAFLLPETLGKKLPDTISEAEMI